MGVRLVAGSARHQVGPSFACLTTGGITIPASHRRSVIRGVDLTLLSWVNEVALVACLLPPVGTSCGAADTPDPAQAKARFWAVASAPRVTVRPD